jgi:hypothetical protein
MPTLWALLSVLLNDIETFSTWNIKLKPEKIEIPESNYANLFSLGSAETNIKTASIQYIKYIKKMVLLLALIQMRLLICS